MFERRFFTKKDGEEYLSLIGKIPGDLIKKLFAIFGSKSVLAWARLIYADLTTKALFAIILQLIHSNVLLMVLHSSLK